MDKIHLFTSANEKGLSLKKLNYIMVIAALMISAVLFFAMRQTNSMYDKAHSTTLQLHKYEETSANLRYASDYLTEQIRLFAITGDKTYLNNYFEEATIKKRRDKALELLQTQHGDSVAYAELQSAMNGSLYLMNMEYRAARLAVDAFGYNLSEYPEEIQRVQLFPHEEALSPQEKGAHAKTMLFDSEYRRQKSYIIEHTEKCLAALEKEIWEKQQSVAGDLEKQMLVEHGLTLLLIAVLLGIVYLTSRLVIFPLQNCVQLIRKDAEIPVRGAAEIRFLAKTYNQIRESNLRRRKQLSYDATHDKLTSLYNRRGFDALLDELDLSDAAVLLVDLDNFKKVNDAHGHDVGDRVLIKVADTLIQYFENEGYVCRFGGDEFVVIMENTTPAMQEYLTEKIHAINEKLQSSADGVPSTTISVGVSFCNGRLDVKETLQQADESLYEAKGTGKSGIRFNDESETA
ncbi:MAG: GGDEF domain-containing protein [Schwartzia sp.]|nr:GGDEF domain-containing protein [Schwartzia sp. (in: firmicutes)]